MLLFIQGQLLTLFYICRYHVMMRCWYDDPAKRPTFQELCLDLETLTNGNQETSAKFLE